MSLVQELQRDALDPKVRVGDLLRKALVVATKLRLAESLEWIELELNGYRTTDLPNYRMTRGQVVLTNRRRGSMPMMFENPEMAETVTLHRECSPVGPLEELILSGTSKSLVVEFPPAMQNLLLQPFPDVDAVPQLIINRSSVVLIIDAVRNAVLKWSLKLEQDGILGEDMSFSDEEKKRAADDAKQLAPQNFITIGTMTNSVIQQGN